MNKYDIAIIGGGPAGATLARLLDKSFRVVLIDKKTDSPESFKKPCGGLLSPDAQKAFAEFDLTLPKSILVSPQIFSVRTIDLKTRCERHYQRFYMNLDRHKFDLWLQSLIPDNVSKICGRVRNISRKEDRYILSVVEKNVGERTIAADKIVGADGAGSVVRKYLYPRKRIRTYTAIQQWFEEENPNPFYSCIFDPETSDCCSWTISKDNSFIFGGAFAPKKCRENFEKQKKRLSEYGFKFGKLQKTEACTVLRPRSPFDICTGKDNAFLVGEAAGFISPSSLEGISFAVNSARILSEVLNSKEKASERKYSERLLPMRIKIAVKVMKCPFMYSPLLREIVMKSKVASINVKKRN